MSYSEEPRFRALLLDTKAANPNHYICLSIANALNKIPEVECVHKVSLGNAIEKAREYECNLFFAFDGEELHKELCKRLADICGFSVLWVTEDPYELSTNVRNSELFDLVFTNDSGSVLAYGGKAHHLPLASDFSIQYHHVSVDQECRYDLFFAGTAWPNRVNFLKNILSGVDGISMKLALSSNPHIPPVDIEHPVSAYSWRTPNSEFSRLANRSRITLGLFRNYSTSIGDKTVAVTPGPRIFEVAMAGGFQLVDGSLPEIEKYFVPDKEIVIFSDANDCVEKVKYFISHPNERISVARAAQNRALKEHTYIQRIGELFSLISANWATKKQTQDISNSSRMHRILMVSHNIKDEGSWGGVEVYQDWISKNISGGFEVWFYVPMQHRDGCILINPEGEVIEKYFFHAASDDLLACDERERAFSQVLMEYSIEAVHFQHLLKHVPSLPIIAKTLGVPTIISLHDYYCICNSFTLIGMTGDYCRVETQGEDGCDLCLARSNNLKPGCQSKRRSFFERVLKSATVLHCNTAGVREVFESVYGELESHKGWECSPVPIAKLRSDLSANRGSHLNRPLKVIIPGNFTKFKGAELLLNVFKVMQDENIEFSILGRIDEEFDGAFLGDTYKNVYIYGKYSQDELPHILRNYDVSLHCSLWPETYCLTLSEAWRSDLIPVVSDIGALGERVIDGVNGFKFPLHSPGKLVSILRNLEKNRGDLNLIRENGAKDISFEDDHLSWIQGLYQSLVKICPSKINIRLNHAYQSITLKDCGVLLNESRWMVNAHPNSKKTIKTAIINLASTPKRPNEFNGYAQNFFLYYRQYGMVPSLIKLIKFPFNRILGR